MLTITVEYMDGKIVKFQKYNTWSIESGGGHTLTIKNEAGIHLIPLLNVRDVYIDKT